jgi:hypothetical protein
MDPEVLIPGRRRPVYIYRGISHGFVLTVVTVTGTGIVKARHREAMEILHRLWVAQY